MKHLFRLLIIVLAIALISIGTALAQSAPLAVVATTTIIADVASQVGRDLVHVTALVPPDSDVHAFEPTPDDLLQVSQADVILVNGLGLEGFLQSLLENAASVQPIVVSTGISVLPFGYPEQSTPEIVGILGQAGVCDDDHTDDEAAAAEAEHPDEHGDCDPHVWTTPQNVKVWASNIAEAFAAADPVNAEVYRKNAEAYQAELEGLDAEVIDILSVVPQEQRILVTNHEFLGYFAAHYGFKIVGVVIGGGTTLNEPNPQQLAELFRIIQEQEVRAIFVEASSNARLAEVLAEDSGFTVVTKIYSDSLSSADGPAPTYLDYLRHNARAIADALTANSA